MERKVMLNSRGKRVPVKRFEYLEMNEIFCRKIIVAGAVEKSVESCQLASFRFWSSTVV